MLDYANEVLGVALVVALVGCGGRASQPTSGDNGAGAAQGLLPVGPMLVVQTAQTQGLSSM